MPKKIRELKSILKKAGFTLLKDRGKGSHTVWEHPNVEKNVILSGKDSKDAQNFLRQFLQWAKHPQRIALSRKKSQRSSRRGK